jgi:glycosyltransferase involved in cell wall biosynthesis
MEPLVSVILTTKNEAKYIEETLKALKNQSYRRIEVIVSDACSSDETVEIARKYADKIVVKETNIAGGRNLGAKHARGEILVFLNADVILEMDWVKNSLKKLQLEDVAMLVGSFSPLEKGLRAKIFCRLCNLFVEFCFLLGRAQTCGECTIAVKRSAFESVGGFREDLACFEDVDLGLRVNKVGRVVLDKGCRGVASLRRFEREGYLKWGLIWLYIGLKYQLVGKSPLEKYPCVR